MNNSHGLAAQELLLKSSTDSKQRKSQGFSLIKTIINQENISLYEYAEAIHSKLGCPSFSLNLYEELKDSGEVKKKGRFNFSWKSVTGSNYSIFLNSECNSLAFKTGKSYGITVIDIDNKSKGDILNGMDIFDSLKVNTVMAKTGNNGRHLYFKYTDRLKTGTNICVDGIRYTIDVKNDT